MFVPIQSELWRTRCVRILLLLPLLHKVERRVIVVSGFAGLKSLTVTQAQRRGCEAVRAGQSPPVGPPAGPPPSVDSRVIVGASRWGAGHDIVSITDGALPEAKRKSALDNEWTTRHRWGKGMQWDLTIDRSIDR